MRAEGIDLSHQRARFAFERVKAWDRAQEAAQLVKGLPVSLRTLGLAQAVAMLTRRGAAARELANDLCGWLLDRSPMKPLGEGRADPVGLVERVTESSPQAVHAAEDEAIRFLEVVKLFGEMVHG
jgi:CRISPR-associated protein (Cas_Cmr5)